MSVIHLLEGIGTEALDPSRAEGQGDTELEDISD